MMISLITFVVSSVNKTFTLILQIHEMQRLSNEVPFGQRSDGAKRSLMNRVPDNKQPQQPLPSWKEQT